MTDDFIVYCGDNREIYSRVPKVQAVITDPPYGDEVHSKDKVGRENGSGGRITNDPVPFEGLSEQDMQHLGRFVGRHVEGWAIIFCQTEQIENWKEWLVCEEVRYFRPMMWIKTNAKPNLRGHGPGVGHETIQSYWCGPGKQRWNGGGKVGVFIHPTRNDYEVKHPTNKPVPLMKELVRYFTDPGDTVFDPFMGCGSTGVAALELGRKFIGIEKNQEYFSEAVRRLREAARPGLMLADDPKAQTLFGDSAFGSIGTRRRLEREAKEREDAG